MAFIVEKAFSPVYHPEEKEKPSDLEDGLLPKTLRRGNVGVGGDLGTSDFPESGPKSENDKGD